ncbi:hypothetical protein PYJP_01990 [Pyrofollis japonicus]|jgi:hypothetical protein|uniref:hypothetical protein n=1 Tax=Pyrofollis japonicus TaxID=3060460 RepID=UPI00295A69C9|nr:hypothetical protein [Pyrofollis japonicus]BEP16847.1 hypothetical protein PYJP_01990 [Pyrofollis japonicus]
MRITRTAKIGEKVDMKGAAGLVLFTVLLIWVLRAYDELESLHPEASPGFEALKIASILVYLVGTLLLIKHIRKD